MEDGRPGPDVTTSGGREQGSGRQVLAWLDGHPDGAFFLSEVQAALGRQGVSPGGVRAAVAALEADGRVAVARYRWDDPHLPEQEFVVVTRHGGPDDGGRAARLDAAWARWLREFLASHRCT